MRVVHVIARLNVGGPASQVLGVAAGLDPAAFDVHVLAGSVGPGEEEWSELRGVDVAVTRLRGLGPAVRPGDDARAFDVLLRELQRLRPDVVHTHTAKAGALGRVAARAAGVRRVVHTYHGHLLTGYFRPAVRTAVVATERALARVTTRLVTVGARVRDDLVRARIGEHSQYRVIGPGVAPPRAPTRSAARVALGLPPDAAVVGFVGRLTRVKRPDRAIAVVRRLVAQGRDVRLLVAGAGDLEAAARRGASDLGERVRWLGWHGDVGSVFSASDVVLLTSDNEGMPVTLVEAAHVGTPVVATDVGSVAEVVRDGSTGLVVPADVDALTAAVATLLDDPARRAAMGAAARARAAAEFSVARMVAEHVELYREVCA